MSPGSSQGRPKSDSPDRHDLAQARRARLTLRPEPGSVPQARRFVASLDFTTGFDSDTLELLTAEIVTNAVLHARTTLVLEATEIPEGIRISVTDGNRNPPLKKDHAPTSPTGRGLRIVESMANRWGFEEAGSGKTVWFELAHQDRPI